MAKTNALLVAYLSRLQTHPLQTKMATSATLSFVQEILANHLASVPMKAKSASPLPVLLARAKVDTKAIKMALYGALVSAPLGHFLVGLLQKAFQGKTSKVARLGQVIASNLIVAPTQTAAYLISLGVINGLRDVESIARLVRSRFFAVLRVSWVTSPLALVIAQNFIPPELWVPWFNLVTFTMGAYLNTKVKRSSLEAQKKN